MQINEKNFQMAVKYGGAVLAISAVFNVYSVMRHFEVVRDLARNEQRSEQLMPQIMRQQQALNGVINEFLSRAATDPKVAKILQRHQILGSAPSSAPQDREQGAKP